MRRLRESARVTVRAADLLFASQPGMLAAFGGVTLVAGVLPVAQPVLLGRLVDDLATAPGSLTTGLLVLAVAYTATLLVPNLLEPVQQTLSAQLEDSSVAAVDHRLMAAGQAMPDLTRVERPALHDAVRLHGDLVMYLTRAWLAFSAVVGSVVPIVGLLIVLGTLHPLVPVALAVAVVPHLLAERRMNELQYEAMRGRSRAAREMDYCARLATEAEGAKEVRVFGLGPYLLDRFHRRFGEAIGELTRIRIRHLGVSAAFSGLHVLALVGGLVYVASRASAGTLSVGDVALYLNAVIAFEQQLFGVGMQVSFVAQVQLYGRRLFEFVDDARPGIALPAADEAVPAPASLTKGVVLRGIEFRYPESDGPVLDGVDLVLPAGEVTALVGENGAGKSTIVKLLTRMYDPTDGEIRLDWRPLAAYDLESLRRQIGVVYQDFARFALSFRDNVGVGEVDGSPDVDRAARLAGADGIVERLPEGYDQMLTRRFPGGVELSGGEWQKVATARGFIRDAALVILDEPTAALDADAERALFDRFRELMAGRTALLISHRFSTVRMADHIAVLEKGRVLEAGTHDELVAAGGRYAELFEMQAGRYR